MKNILKKIVFVMTILGVQCAIVQHAAAQQQWVQTNGPSGGGDPYMMAASGSIVYAYWSPKSVCRSADGGQTWTSIGFPGYGGVYSIAMDGVDLYVGMKNGLMRYSAATGTWTDVSNALGDDYMGYNVRVFGQTICIGMGAGVFISRDKGATWKSKVLGGGDIAYDFLVFGSTVLAATYAGAYRTTDNGTTWTNVSSKFFPQAVRVFTVIGSDIFAGTTGGVYKSSDLGSTWTDASSGMNRSFLTVSGLQFMDNVFVAITTNGMYRSTDIGANWVASNNGLKYSTIGSSGGYFLSSLAATGNSFCVGQVGQGIFRSTDQGVTWKPSSTGIVASRVTKLHGGEGYVLACVPDLGIFRTTDKGIHWEVMNGPSATIASFLSVGGDILAATDKGIWRSSDVGMNWNRMNDSLTSLSVSSLAVCDSLIFAGANLGLYVSRDQGRTWASAPTTFAQSGITALAAYGSTIYASTPYQIYASLNSGKYWSKAVDYLSASAMTASGSSLFFLNGYNVYQAQGNGQTWSYSNVGVKNALSMAAVGSTLYVGVGGPGGMYSAPMNGTAWKWEGNGMDKSIWALAASGTDMYLGTPGDGVYRQPITITSASDLRVSGTATGFELSQNYPNPFNPTTTITYSLAEWGRISLTVFDVLGRERGVLVDAVQPAGVHTVSFDGSRLQSGMYFYTLTAGTARISKKMLLVK